MKPDAKIQKGRENVLNVVVTEKSNNFVAKNWDNILNGVQFWRLMLSDSTFFAVKSGYNKLIIIAFHSTDKPLEPSY